MGGEIGLDRGERPPGGNPSGASRDHWNPTVLWGGSPQRRTPAIYIVRYGRSMALHRPILITRARYTCTAAVLISEQPWNSRPQLDHLRGPFPFAVASQAAIARAGARTVAAPVAAFDRALDAMPKSLLDQLVRKTRSFVAPIF